MEASARLDRLLGAARRRLRARSGLRAGALGLHAGAWIALPAGLVLGLSGQPPLVVGGAVAAVIVGAGASGFALGAVRAPIDRRATAFALDRLTGSDELLLNAVHALDVSEPNREAILARLDGPLPDPAAFALARPRHLRFAPIPLLAMAIGIALLPRLPDPRDWFGSPSTDPVAAVATDLRERLARPEASAGVELPPELQKSLERLTDDLAAQPMSKEEAERRLADMQRQLSEFEASLQESAGMMKDLEDAAKQLQQDAPGLGEALAEGDLGAAASEAKDLAEQLAQGSPEERRAAADAMRRAGDALAGSKEPSLQQAGKALQRAGDELGDEGAGTLSDAAAEDLARDLEAAREAGRQLQQDRQAMKESQEAAAALEAARQQLGGAATVDAGEGEGEGEPEPGEGQGAGPNGVPGNQAGAGHTWEDQGEFGERPTETTREGGGTAEHQQLDDFQRLYDELRLEGAKSLVTGTQSRLNEEGRMDVLETRLTTAEEVAKAGTVELPATYRDAASEAVSSEQVPAGYRDAVKQYFDGMD